MQIRESDIRLVCPLRKSLAAPSKQANSRRLCACRSARLGTVYHLRYCQRITLTGKGNVMRFAFESDLTAEALRALHAGDGLHGRYLVFGRYLTDVKTGRTMVIVKGIGEPIIGRVA